MSAWRVSADVVVGGVLMVVWVVEELGARKRGCWGDAREQGSEV